MHGPMLFYYMEIPRVVVRVSPSRKLPKSRPIRTAAPRCATVERFRVATLKARVQH